MAKYSVSITYVRPDPSVPHWTGGEEETYSQYLLDNYISKGKIINEYITHISPTEKTFTRVFDSQASWIEFRDDPNRATVIADRESHCLQHNITATRVESEIPD